MKKTNLTIKYKRRRYGQTNYTNRLGMLKSGVPRLVIRKSLKNINVQIVKYEPDGDKVLFSSNSKQLAKYGWKYSRSNVPAAYLTGLLCAKKSKNVGETILDVGQASMTKGNSILSALKGSVDGGLKVMHSEDLFPETQRITGSHIAKFADQAKDYPNQNSGYKKKGIDAKNIEKDFADVKKKILGEK